MKLIKLLCLLIVFFLFGCSNQKYITCNINLNNELNNYKREGTYIVYYNDKYVSKVEKEDEYISNDKSVLDYFSESNRLSYEDLNNKYGGIDYTIDNKENEVVIKANIDFSKADVKKMSKDGFIDKDYVVSNKLTLSGIKYIYESKGFKCQ